MLVYIHVHVHLDDTICKFIFLYIAQLQQKGLPKWLKEELERLEKKKVKDMERSIQESSKQDERKHPRWKDEVDEPEETGEHEREKRRSHSPHYRKRSLSQSPTRVRNILYVISCFMVLSTYMYIYMFQWNMYSVHVQIHLHVHREDI